MRKLFFLIAIVFFMNLSVAEGSEPVSLSISGSVRQPLILTMEDLKGFEQIEVQLNEVLSNGQFKGVFRYRGVPLQTLLNLAFIQKKAPDFKKSTDLAILVRSRDGRKAVLSWGEVFYKNPARVTIGLSSRPVRPHKEKNHIPASHHKWLKELDREVRMPRLVLSDDFYSDRCLEGINSIQVVELERKIKSKKMSKLFSPQFSIERKGRVLDVISEMADYPRMDITINVVGEGKGYHGTNTFNGVPLKEIMKKALGTEADLDTVFLLSAPDGYRALLSYGELFQTLSGDRILISDRNDKPAKKGGLFNLIIPDDLMADRWVYAVDKIEVIPLKGFTLR
jgi:hypothetical protein